jgi:hypothetical protein
MSMLSISCICLLIAVKRSPAHFTKLDVLCAVFKQYRLQNMCMADGTAITTDTVKLCMFTLCSNWYCIRIWYYTVNTYVNTMVLLLGLCRT